MLVGFLKKKMFASRCIMFLEKLVNLLCYVKLPIITLNHLAQVFMWVKFYYSVEKRLVIASQWFSPFGNVLYLKTNWLLILPFRIWWILTTNGRIHLLGKHNMKMSKQLWQMTKDWKSQHKKTKNKFRTLITSM